MPLFMDIHHLDEVDPDALAGAHERDLQVQARYGVDYQRYWFSRDPARVFGLDRAPPATVAPHRPSTSSLPVSAIAIACSMWPSCTPNSSSVSRK